MKAQEKVIEKIADPARNTCRLCAPLGASTVFRGIENCIPLLHGSQGCSTYIRRYMISHFREPVDIASSNFSESAAVFGGRENLHTALDNVIGKYQPSLVGIATTCLSETIGDDVSLYIKEYNEKSKSDVPVVNVPTPSYKGIHTDGYRDAVISCIKTVSKENESGDFINIIPAFVSPEDLRHLKEIASDFKTDAVLFPDYSETLDGESWESYKKISPGGTLLRDIARIKSAKASIVIGNSLARSGLSGSLSDHLPNSHFMNLPIGIDLCDEFFGAFEKATGKPLPEKYSSERNRLVDSYMDAHKYFFEKRAIIAGDEDLVVSLASFMSEIGIVPVICATGSDNPAVAEIIKKYAPDAEVMSDSDYATVLDKAQGMNCDLVIGSSKGFYLSKNLSIPLVRVGFPVHDRFGSQRIKHLGYRGTQSILDNIANAIIEHKQNSSNIGYSYL